MKNRLFTLFLVCIFSGAALAVHDQPMTKKDLVEKSKVVVVAKVVDLDKDEKEVTLLSLKILKGYIDEEFVLPTASGDIQFDKEEETYVLYLTRKGRLVSFGNNEPQRKEKVQSAREKAVEDIEALVKQLYGAKITRRYIKIQKKIRDVKEELPEAIRTKLEKAAEKEGGFKQYLKKGLQFSQEKQEQQAYVAFKTAARIFANDLHVLAEDVFYDKAEAYDEGKLSDPDKKTFFDTGTNYLEWALELDKHNHDVLTLLGKFCLLHGAYDRAVEAYQKVLKRDPKDMESWLFLGYVFEEKKSWDEGIEAFKKVIAEEPERAYNGIGRCYTSKKEYDKALDFYKKAYNIDPDDEEAKKTYHYNLACLYSLQSKLDKCFESLKTIAELLIEDPEILEWAKKDPELENARGDDRFNKILKLKP